MSQWHFSPLRTEGAVTRLGNKRREGEKSLKVFCQWDPSTGQCMPVQPWPEQNLPWRTAVGHERNIRRPGQRWSEVVTIQSPWDWLSWQCSAGFRETQSVLKKFMFDCQQYKISLPSHILSMQIYALVLLSLTYAENKIPLYPIVLFLVLHNHIFYELEKSSSNSLTQIFPFIRCICFQQRCI